jgi:predicted nucleic acid-binding protein
VLVIDASITLAWTLPDERDSYALAVLDEVLREGALVPAIWALEIGNGLVIAERRKRLSPAQRADSLVLLSKVPVSVVRPSLERDLGPVLSLAKTHSLTTYDAAYLEVAVASGHRLATLDDNLKRVAKKLGVAHEH